MKTEAIIKHIVNWIKNYCLSANVNHLVIGISGGIDSAVTSTLAAKTKLPLLCLEMPIYQNKSEVLRAKNHINFLKSNYKNVSSFRVDLTPVLNQFIKTLPKTKKSEEEISLVNTRARLRMTTLYYFSRLNNSIVIGTGNKVEDFGVGFFTKYGDGGVDISPIADLNKTEVFSLGKTLNISKIILNAPPTDGLWSDNRTDEEQIGATYKELEWAMRNTDKKVLSKREKEVLTIFKKLNRKNQHKMQPIPVCQIANTLKNN